MRGQGEYGYGSLQESQTPFLDQQAGDSQFRSLFEKTGSSIQRINSNVSSLERSVRQIGTSSDSVQLRNKITTVLHDVGQNVTKTQTSIKRLKELGRSLSKESRLQVERITNQFLDTVQRFIDIQKRVANQMKAYPDLPKESPFRQEEENYGFDSTEDNSQSQAQQLETEEMEYNLTLLEERERQVRDIESAIVDVNEIFRDLSAMVVEQGDMIDSIEANVERGSDNVTSARQELQKAEVYQKKARRKQACIVACLVIVVAVIVLIVVLAVKK